MMITNQKRLIEKNLFSVLIVLFLLLLLSSCGNNPAINTEVTDGIVTVPPWQEIEKALIATMPDDGIPHDIDYMCEWDVLGQTDNEIYLWAFCRKATTDVNATGQSWPLVLKLSDNHEIIDVQGPRDGFYTEDISALFPLDIAERIRNRYYMNPVIMEEHINLRVNEPGMPPLIAEQTSK